MATTITRTPMIDDDGTGTTGTVINNAWKQELYGQIDTALAGVDAATRTVISDVTTGTVNVWNLPTGANPHLTVVWSGAADLDVSGITQPSVVGAQVRVLNVSARNIYFHHYVSANANALLLNAVTSGVTPVGTGGSITYVFDPTTSTWRLAQHEQGAMIPWPFNAAMFSAPSGSWTVDSSDVVANLYAVRGKQLYLNCYLGTTTLAGSPPSLYVTVPYGFTHTVYGLGFANDGPGNSQVYVNTTPNQGIVVVNKPTFAAFGNITNGGTVSFILAGVSIL